LPGLPDFIDKKTTLLRTCGDVAGGDSASKEGNGVYFQRPEELVIPTSLRFRLCVAVVCCCLVSACAQAEPIPVRHVEGTQRGFLSARTADGKLIAMGDFYQIVHGDRVTLRLVFHFKDGSVDDETTVYTERKNFQLISDRHIQRGPFFPHPMDVLVDARSGQVTVRSTGKDGKEEVTTEHLDLPADVANGLGFVAAKNVPPGSTTTVSMVLALPKPRLVKIVFTAGSEDPFSVGGFARKAMRIEVKIELGGLAGVVAPLIGKEPPDIYIWIAGGDAPAFVKEVGYLYRDGPTLTIELMSPVWPVSPDAKIVGPK
jgi:hypothetical protein